MEINISEGLVFFIAMMSVFWIPAFLSWLWNKYGVRFINWLIS